MTWLTVMEYLCHKLPRICSTCRKHFPVLSSFMTYYRFLTTLTQRVSLVEQELFTLPEHLSSPPVFSGVRVSRSLVWYVCFIDRCFCPFVLFLLAIVLSGLLRYTDSDYSFGIFKLFLISMFVFHLSRSKKWTHILSGLRKLLSIWLGLMNTRFFFYKVPSWWKPEKITL